MNDLQRFFERNTGSVIHKWTHYFTIYDRHFARFRGTDVHILEIGIDHGGSLRMWRDYFGPKASIYAVDINPHCNSLEQEGTQIFIGNQGDRQFLRSLRERIHRIDILIDDGGHTMRQQIATFEELFPHISPNGVYLCEDLHTSYWWPWGGGYRQRRSFIEYSKQMIDWLNAWHSRQPLRLRVSDFTRSVDSLHFYDSVLVIEKRPRTAPEHQMTGLPLIPECPKHVHSLLERLALKFRRL